MSLIDNIFRGYTRTLAFGDNAPERKFLGRFLKKEKKPKRNNLHDTMVYMEEPLKMYKKSLNLTNIVQGC